MKTVLNKFALAMPRAGGAKPVERVRRVYMALPSSGAERRAIGATYRLTNEHGEITALVSIAQRGIGCTRKSAGRMAHSGDMAGVLRQASRDYELTGAVSPETMAQVRQVLATVDRS